MACINGTAGYRAIVSRDELKNYFRIPHNAIIRQRGYPIRHFRSELVLFVYLRMENKEFNTFIKIKIQALVDRIMERKSLLFEDAINYLYNSRTYKMLLNENSKIWHYSTEKLFEILENEYKNNKLTFPDYA